MKHDGLTVAAKIFLFFQMTTVFPLIMYLLRLVSYRGLLCKFLTCIFPYIFQYVFCPFVSRPIPLSWLLNNILEEIFHEKIYYFLFVFCRVSVLYPIFRNVWPGLKYVLLLNTAVISVCVIFAIFMPKIGTIIRYIGD